MAQGEASKHASYAGVEVPLTPGSPLKSALKVPGTPARFANPLSPTFHEEQILEKHEASAEKENAKDLVSTLLGRSPGPGLTIRAESQDSSTDGENGITGDKFQL